MEPSQFCASDVIVCIFPGALGDFLCFSSALAGLRRATPARIRVVARQDWLALLPTRDYDCRSIENRAVAEIFGAASLEAARSFVGDAALVHSWTGHDAGVAERILAAGAGAVRSHRFLGFDPGEHAVDYYARCLGVRPVDVPLRRDADAAAWASDALRAQPEPRVVLHAGSGSARKNWLGHGAVAQALRTAGASVIELLGPAEEKAEPLSAATIVIRQPLPRVLAVLDAGSVYVGNDSGITHLAAASGIPALAVFGGADLSHWRPRSPAVRVAQAIADCDLCDPEAFCVHRLPVATVRRQLELMLAGL